MHLSIPGRGSKLDFGCVFCFEGVILGLLSGVGERWGLVNRFAGYLRAGLEIAV